MLFPFNIEEQPGVYCVMDEIPFNSLPTGISYSPSQLGAVMDPK